MSIQQTKAIPIADLMQRIGHEPIRIANDDAWYLSPFRKESNPSFKVNKPKNVSYDHGEGSGGDGVKLILGRTVRKLARRYVTSDKTTSSADAGVVDLSHERLRRNDNGSPV